MNPFLTKWLVLLPILIPFVSSSFLLLFRRQVTDSSQNLQRQRNIGIFTGVLQLIAALLLLQQVLTHGILNVQSGNWPVPFGISFVADGLSSLMVLIVAAMALAVNIFGLSDITESRQNFSFQAIYLLLIAALSGAFLTGDLFNLYVWFEILLISSFVLLSLGNERMQLRGAVNYVLINLIASSLFLTATGLLYGHTGSLNMADIAVRLSEVPTDITNVLAILFLVAFGMKAALFPLFFWLPPSYPAPPVAISAVFAGLLTKVGVYALIRVFTMFFVYDIEFTHTILLWLSGLTIIVGVLSAIVQDDIRKIISFHLIAQVGYMIAGLAFYTDLGLRATIFYFIEDIVVMTNLFLLAGLIARYGGSFKLSKLGNLYRDRPYLAILFALSAFSLGGIPPLSGFWAKLMIIQASFDKGHLLFTLILLFGAFVTLFSMARIWREAFLKKNSAVEVQQPELFDGTASSRRNFYTPVIALTALTLIISFFPQPFYRFSANVSAELLEPTRYINHMFSETNTASPFADKYAEDKYDDAEDAKEEKPEGDSE